tara:strand:+ start:1012 stop:1881 length:870 start_codon:yes stop_codon:yes gene_type:complete
MNKKLKIFIIFICLLISNIEFLYACSETKNSDRITVAGGSVTEILYFLGSEDNIIAVDVTSNYPEEAQSLPSIGYVRNLSAEGILSLKPSIIIGEDDMGPPSVIDQIKRTGIDIYVIEENHTSEGIIDKIKCIGNILGKKEKTNKLIEDVINPLKNELDIKSNNPYLDNVKVMFILSMDSGTPVVSGKKTSADGFINMTGASNAFKDFEGWKPVGTESIIDAAPDFILISNRGAHSYSDLDKISEHPSIKYTPAALNGNIIALDGMEMLGFGPRTISSALKLSDIFTGN